MSSDHIYLDNLLDHYRNPRNYGEIKNPDFVIEDANLSCGDEVKFFVKFDKNKNVIEDIKFVSRSCAVCKASASILTELVKGKPISFVNSLTKKDVLNFFGGRIDPSREKCALLPLRALQSKTKAIEEDSHKNQKDLF
ncbi:MAG: iron-sulfur cluster assembly scaffold protein [Thermoproteota archaeon]|nr:iron-sulfur cluster assembly scaffold protein [Candidatus Brockarchaeota archaeon]MBO3768691.1 iron-sulfur cluster assembly scaffold protein [Candidatus Brockarchaeota archaeon]MBO3801277.1 iron-sulfur cluster assembly scaffold protein [Candidatus Brockarchaeota archaeon]